MQCCGSIRFWYGYGSGLAFHFVTDPDPAFQFDTVRIRIRILAIKRDNVPKTVLFIHLLDFPVGPTGHTQKVFFVKFSISVNFVVLIRVAYGSGSWTPEERIWIRILKMIRILMGQDLQHCLNVLVVLLLRVEDFFYGYANIIKEIDRCLYIAS